ncbi:MAG: hypothetical protein JJE16_10740, partial [Nitrospiraceae bacterium]|nr:hypothetical protein [Nitrospiraceae bacterium]
MTIIQRLSETIGEVRAWFRPIGHKLVPVSVYLVPVSVYKERRIDGRTRKAFCGALIACAMIGPSLPLPAWT